MQFSRATLASPGTQGHPEALRVFAQCLYNKGMSENRYKTNDY